MFLTRFEINPARRGARKLLGSPHVLHAAIQASFPVGHTPEADPMDLLPDPVARRPGAAADGGRVLWRLDQADHQTILYILSPERPDCTHLVEQAGRPATQGWVTRSYSPLLDRLANGQMWAFRLTANPTRSARLKEGKRSQRVGHVTVGQQLEWFTSRTTGWGFSLPDADSGDAAVQVTYRRQRSFARAGHTVEISTVGFDGRLVIENSAAFRAALVKGIGPAKGYGCGLMTLARPADAP
jgi:CRISPR system Cascade subunit CasE